MTPQNPYLRVNLHQKCHLHVILTSLKTVTYHFLAIRKPLIRFQDKISAVKLIPDGFKPRGIIQFFVIRLPRVLFAKYLTFYQITSSVSLYDHFLKRYGTF